MVGTPYHRGRSREYQVLKLLRKEGWLCSRSAMSHGPIDVFAARNGKDRLIQVKSGTGRMSSDDKIQLKHWAKSFKAYGELWLFRKGKIEKEILYSPHANLNRNGTDHFSYF